MLGNLHTTVEGTEARRGWARIPSHQAVEFTLSHVLEAAMNQIQEIRSMIRNLNYLQQVTFALACAEHVAPAFYHLASSASAPVYQETLAAAWQAAAEGTLPSLDGQRALDLPESEVDDPYRRDYFAMRALDVLRFALETISRTRNQNWVDLACCGALDIYSDFDGFEAGWPRGTIDPRDPPPPPGRLKSLEIRAQRATLEMLQSNAPTAEIGNRVREHASVASQQLDAIVPEFLKRGLARDQS